MVFACLVSMAAVAVQATPPASPRPVPPPAPAAASPDEIVVTGRRPYGSAIGETQPIAVLDADALRALGATTMNDLMTRLGPLARSATGAEPALLLNGRRISGFDDLRGIPPEAMERTEILSEADAARFGFPPTVRVMNFVTRKNFRAVTVQQLAGITSEGSGSSNYVELGSAAIDGARRTTFGVTHNRQNPILQSQRAIAPDPATPFAIGGNVTGAAGGSIDPRLDALAGRTVTIAAVPGQAAVRRTLSDYAGGAGAVSDIGPFRTLVGRSDTIRVEGTHARPLSGALDLSLNLSVEGSRSAGLNGLATAVLPIAPGGFLPFADDVVLYRYLPGAVLRQRGNRLALRGGGTVNGRIGRWNWNVSGTYDQARDRGTSDQGVAIDALQAAIAAGGDPLAPVDAGARRLTVRSRTDTGTLVGKAVATGPLVQLPAGPAELTVTADYARSTSTGRLPGSGGDAALDLHRSTGGASVNATLPIASPDRGILTALGQVSATGMLGISDVSDYGRLLSSNLGLNWVPLRWLDVTGSINRTQTPPAITLLTAPTLIYPNTPFFDFATGTSLLVTTVVGGNPALDPERRRVTTVGLGVAPIKGKELRLNLSYVDTRIRNQSAILSGALPIIQSAFPGRFVRDAAGTLTRVDLRSINIAAERERKLLLSTNIFMQLGPEPAALPVAPGQPGRDTPPPPPPKPRPVLFASMTTTVRLDNHVTLRRGIAPLDLLDGSTLDGSGGRPRWEWEGNLGIGIGGLNISIFAHLQGPTRIRSELAASDLRFSGRTSLALFGGFDAERLTPAPWAKRLTFQVTIDNLLNDRIEVRDRTGATPNRFQPALLDPVGRSIRLGVRKMF
ncbi:TonB-dependent receptor [Sphingomonas sp. 1P08PE]|uniref:TonB-dependent receptor n=1 Tax=Sphingomonas sp. 1P08PE TaxID=554122 RepID=UPI0039A0592C